MTVKYFETNGFSIEDLDLKAGSVRACFTPIPWRMAAAYRAETVRGRALVLKCGEAVMVAPRPGNAHEAVLVALVSPSEEQRILTRCLDVATLPKELKDQIVLCLKGRAADVEAEVITPP